MLIAAGAIAAHILLTSLTPKSGYYSATEYTYLKNDTLDVVSIVIPVVPGDKVKSSGFTEPQPERPEVIGGRVTFLKDNTIVVSKSPSEIYAEYTQYGYITVPEGFNAVCLSWWNAVDTNWAYLLVD